MIKCFRPMEQVFGVGHTHLGVPVPRGPEKVHPVFAINFLGDDRSRFRPLHIPLALVSGKDNASPLPVDQVGRRSKAELGVLLVRTNSIHIVVSGIREVKSPAKFYQSRIFSSAALFVRRLSDHYRLRAALEMNTIVARSKAKRRSAFMVLVTIENVKRPVLFYNGRVECSRRFETVASRRYDGIRGEPRPGFERRSQRRNSHRPDSGEYKEQQV